MKWVVAAAVALGINIAVPLLTSGDDIDDRAQRRMERAFDARGADVSDVECRGYTCTARDANGAPIACQVSPGGPARDSVTCSLPR